MTGNTAVGRLSRLLALVPWLMQHDGVTVDAAAAHFGVTREQLEKDLWLLVVCGLPGYGPDQLVDIQFWDDGIHVIDPQVLDRPLRLTEAEATALMLAVRLLAQVPGTHDREALMTLTTKLEQALDLPGDLPVVLQSANQSVLEAVHQALQQGRALRIRYVGAAADAMTERVIHPRQMLVDVVPPALLAYCDLAGAVRTFRLDRIQHAEFIQDSEPNDSRADVDALDSSQDAGLPTTAPPQRALVALDPQVRWALDVYGMADAVPASDGRLQAHLAYWDPRWVVRLVLSLRGAAEVLEPPELRQAVVVAAHQALAGYADPAGG